MPTFSTLLSSISNSLNRGDKNNAQIAEFMCEALNLIEKDHTYLHMEQVLKVSSKEWIKPAGIKSVLGAAHTEACLYEEHYTVGHNSIGNKVKFKSCSCCPIWVKVAAYTSCDPFPADQEVPCAGLVRLLVKEAMGSFLNDPDAMRLAMISQQRAFGAAYRADIEARNGGDLGCWNQGRSCEVECRRCCTGLM